VAVSVVAKFGQDVLIENFFKKAVDFISVSDRLLAASTEKPLETTVRKLKHFCSLKTE